MDAWVWWIVVALVLGIVETQTTVLVAGMIGIGALAGAATAALGAPPAAQVAAFAVLSALLLLVARPIARRHLRIPTELRTGVQALIGQDALVLERVDHRSGRVKIGGEVWSARHLNPDVVVEVGDTVQVLSIDGATALVA